MISCKKDRLASGFEAATVWRLEPWKADGQAGIIKAEGQEHATAIAGKDRRKKDARNSLGAASVLLSTSAALLVMCAWDYESLISFMDSAISLPVSRLWVYLTLGVLKHLSGWNPVQEILELGSIDGAFILAPIAMDLFGCGVPLKIILLAHKNGSICVRKKGKWNGSVSDFFRNKKHPLGRLRPGCQMVQAQ